MRKCVGLNHLNAPEHWPSAGGQSDEFEGGTRLRVPPLAEIAGEHHVVEERQPPERPRDLKGAPEHEHPLAPG
jgi:hypothetical protein